MIASLDVLVVDVNNPDHREAGVSGFASHVRSHMYVAQAFRPAKLVVEYVAQAC
jgi:hypothetical protein